MVPPSAVSPAAATVKASAIPVVEGSSQSASTRTAMPAKTMRVTVTIVQACALAVRRACVPGSVDRSQSQKPVAAASTDAAAPPISVNDAAR
jgi:hypothetical protein